MTKLGYELAKLIEVHTNRIPCDKYGYITLRLETNTKPALDMIDAIRSALADS